MSTIEKALQKNKAQQKDKPVEQQAATEENAAQVQPEQTTIEKSGAIAHSQTKAVVQEEPAEQEASATADAPTEKKRKKSKLKPRTISLENLDDGFVTKIGRHTINEEFRAIKRKVLSNAFGPLAKTLNNSNIIMVSSPNPNEGKTFTAINLAMSIALEQDKTVLLVDADVLRPSVMRTIGAPFDNGLMEYLLGEVDDLSEIIHHTSLDTLRIIPAGKTHHLSTELLASEKMAETINEFAHRYKDRVVIIDSPPLLGINETAVLANFAGQGVIVVHEGKTSLTKLSKAVDQLGPDMAKGFVINRATRGADDGSGYYGYYYGSQQR